MGGYGSGRHWHSKSTTSDYHQVDVRRGSETGSWWRVDPSLVGGGTLKWSHPPLCAPNLIGLFCAHGRADPPIHCGLHGRHAITAGPGCGVFAQQEIAAAVAILYWDGSSPVGTAPVAYDSQHDSGWHRSVRRARAIRNKTWWLSEPGRSFPEKPNGMHWRTY